MEKYAKWSIVAAVSWTFFFIVLFGGIIKQTSVIHEYGCTVKEFNVDPRFDCNTKCPLIESAEDAFELESIVNEFQNDFNEFEDFDGHRREPAKPSCDDLERDTLNWYSPKICLKAKWGFEDPLCPPEQQVCFSGNHFTRKCYLKCPLAYTVNLRMNVDHIGDVDMSRDLGINSDKYEHYKNEYAVGKRTSCQVVGRGNDIKWVDERLSHDAFAWWKWSLFTGTMLASVIFTIMAIIAYVKLSRERQVNPVYTPIESDGTANA